MKAIQNIYSSKYMTLDGYSWSNFLSKNVKGEVVRMNNKKLAQEIIKELGGEENIVDVLIV